MVDYVKRVITGFNRAQGRTEHTINYTKKNECEFVIINDAKGVGYMKKSIFLREHFNVDLRDMTLKDWSNYVSHVVDANELYYQYGYEPTEELIECISTMTPNVVYYSVYLKDENMMVGYVGITPGIGYLEFYIFKEFRKKGLGAAAVDLLIQFWFSGQINGRKETEIKAETLSENLASIRLLEKLGFKKDAAGFRMALFDEDANGHVIGLSSYVLKNDSNC